MNKKSVLTLLTLVILVPILSIQASSLDEKNQYRSNLPDPGIPLMFIENVGQFDEQVRFQVRGNKKTIWLTQDAIWITLLQPTSDDSQGGKIIESAESNWILEDTIDHESIAGTRVNIKLSFDGANPSPQLQPFNKLETSFNYYLGSDPRKWHDNVPAWGGIRYKNLYPGVDLEITGDNNQWAWRLTGNTTMSDVCLSVEGAKNLSINNNRLILATTIGDLVFPLISTDLKTPVRQSVIFEKHQRLNQESLTFNVSSPFFNNTDDYFNSTPQSQSKPDNPDHLFLSTYLGGEGFDVGEALVLDDNENILITGYTDLIEFSRAIGVFSPVIADDEDDDIFIFKLSSDGANLVFCTFMGGNNDDRSNSLVLDSNSNIVITGETWSSDYPTTEGTYDATFNGNIDIFISKLASSGNALLFSTYVGGNNWETSKDLKLDNGGDLVIVGCTDSNNFPTTPKAYDTSLNGQNEDMIVFKLSPDGKKLRYGTFIGASDGECGNALAVDGNGNLFIAGKTSSYDFPITLGAYDSSQNGWNDIVVLKLKPAGKGKEDLQYSTFIGGITDESAEGVAVDKLGNFIVTGSTKSYDFPTTSGAYDTSKNGYSNAIEDIVVFKLKPVGSGKADLIYSTFIGGLFRSVSKGLMLDDEENPIVFGWTDSEDFPISTKAFDTTHNGGQDIFILKLAKEGNNLLYSTFIGGNNRDEGLAFLLDKANNAIFTGLTRSSDYPTTVGAYDTTIDYRNLFDCIVSKIAVPPFPISGFVKDPSNNGVPGIEISAGNGISAITDINGYYSIYLYDIITTTLTPSSNDFIFYPMKRVIYVPPRHSEQNFIAYNIYKQVLPSDHDVIDYKDTLTYTVQLAYPEDKIMIFFDQIPTHTCYISNSLNAPASINYDSTINAISGTLSITAGIPQIITFTASIQVTGTTEFAPIITNRACVFPINGNIDDCEWSNKVFNFTYVWPIYLPVLSR